MSQIESGLPVVSVAQVAKRSGISIDMIRTLAKISSSSYARRKITGRLSPEESDRVYRLGRITEHAIDFFEGDIAAAQRWLSHPAKALGGSMPMSLLVNDAGVRQVENLLNRLEDGVFT